MFHKHTHMSSNSVTYQEYTQRLRRADMYSIVKDQMIELGIGKTGTELYEKLSPHHRAAPLHGRRYAVPDKRVACESTGACGDRVQGIVESECCHQAASCTDDRNRIE